MVILEREARLCVEGAALMYAFCDEHQIRYERCGKRIVALEEAELPRLDELDRRGRSNGVLGLRRLTAAEIQDVEPECRGIAALHSPSTGIVNYAEVAQAIARDLQRDNVNVRFDARVRRLDRHGAGTELVCAGGSVSARFVIACAGLWSDRLAVSAGAPADPRIVPFRGAYLTLKPSSMPLVRGLVYPVPGTWKMGRRYWRNGIDEFMTVVAQGRVLRAAERYVPAVTLSGVQRQSSCGVRAQALSRDGSLVDDFIISETWGAVHVRNAPSPAATSSLALAR
jgi:L-2-hydroxyglutarate oxidase LhgO